MTCDCWIKIQFSWIGIYKSCYHFVRDILSVPFCPIPFCPVTGKSRPLQTACEIMSIMSHNELGGVECSPLCHLLTQHFLMVFIHVHNSPWMVTFYHHLHDEFKCNYLHQSIIISLVSNSCNVSQRLCQEHNVMGSKPRLKRCHHFNSRASTRFFSSKRLMLISAI